MLPEIHRMYTENVDDYNLIVPYYPFRNMIWDWRLTTFHNPGIRMKAHSELGGEKETYPWIIGIFLPPSHGKCAKGFRNIIRKELVDPSDLNFILSHWNQDLFNHLATEVTDKTEVECLRSGCGIVLGLILREISQDPILRPLREWTDIALEDYGSNHFRRCVYTETDNLFY